LHRLLGSCSACSARAIAIALDSGKVIANPIV
jgi:hypothetical protein